MLMVRITDNAASGVPGPSELIKVPTVLADLVGLFGTYGSKRGPDRVIRRECASATRQPIDRASESNNNSLWNVEVHLQRQIPPRHFGTCFESGTKIVACCRFKNQMQNESEAYDKAIAVFSPWNTDLAMTILSLYSLAEETSAVTTNPLGSIAKIRGWTGDSLDGRSRPNASTRRDRLQSHLMKLDSIEFMFNDQSGECNCMFHPLLITDRHSVGATIYRLHPLLIEELQAKCRAMLFVKPMLSADSRKHEWPVRLLIYMTSRWARNWVTKYLDVNSGWHCERLGVLLMGAGICYENQLQSQGKKWLMNRFRDAMDQLKHWSPFPLIGDYQIKLQHSEPRESQVRFRPTEEVAKRFSALRSKSIQNREKRIKAGRRRASA